MQSKPQSWYQALTASSANWRHGVDILAADEVTLLENPLTFDQNATDRLVPRSGQVTLDSTAKTHRALKLSLRNTDGRYLPGVSGVPSGGVGSPLANGLVWYNVRYRPWIDLQVGWDSAFRPVYDRTYLGVYVLTDPEVQVRTVGSQIVLSLLDKSSLLCKPFLITAGTLPTFTKGGHTSGGYAAGSTFDSVMRDLAVRGGIPASKLAFEASSLTLPADYAITEGTEWWTHLQTLAQSMAHVIYFDSLGNLVRRSNPLMTNLPSVYTFKPGQNAIVSAVDRKTKLAQTYNHVVVTGGSSTTTTYRGEAQVTDPSNPYHKNLIGDRVVYVGKDGKLNDMTPDPTIGSTAQANQKAGVLLAQYVGQQEVVQLTTRNMPALEPYDRITISVPGAGLAMDFQVQQMTWNLSHDGMTITSTRWFQVGS